MSRAWRPSFRPAYADAKYYGEITHPSPLFTELLTAEFAGLAKYYGVGVDLCPSRHGNRKGVVEKANHSAAQRWWRTLPDDTARSAAQAGVDALAGRMDGRRRARGGQRVSVGHRRSWPRHSAEELTVPFWHL